MGKELYHHYLPHNARVIVDYGTTNPKDKVKFSFPRRHSKSSASLLIYAVIFIYWIIFLGAMGIILIALAFGFVITYSIITYPYSIYSIQHLNPYNVTTVSGSENSIVSAIINDRLEIQVIKYNYLLTKTFEPPSYYASILIFFFGPPTLFYLLFIQSKKRVGKWMPKLMYNIMTFGGRYLYEARFKPIDVKDNKIILPFFRNVYLNYKPSGEFGKYLKKVTVWDIPLKSRGYPSKKYKPFKIRNQSSYFYALFEFIKAPANGDIKIIFY